MNINFTKGSITKSLFIFLIPVLVGNFFQQLYTTVDALIIGKYVGTLGLASIDAVMNLIRIPIVFLIGLSIGGTILISQYYGAKQFTRQRRATHTLVAFSFVAGFLISLLGYLLSPFILNLLKVPNEIYNDSLIYLKINFAGMIFVLVYNICSSILRAIGDSRTPFYILFICCIVNIFLDYYFVVNLHMGVSGVAIATLIAQAISSLISVVVLTKLKTSSKLYLNKLSIKYPIFIRMLRVGVPIGIQSSLYPIANLLVQTKINSTGTNNIAAWALTGKMNGVVWIVLDSLTQATLTFVAQNYGANNIERIKKGLKISLLNSSIVMISISLVLYFFSRSIALFFIDDLVVVDLSVKILMLLIPFYVLYAIGDILSSGIRGSGQTIAPTVITLITCCLLRVLWILFVVRDTQNILNIIVIFPITWILNCIVFIIYFIYYKNKKLK